MLKTWLEDETEKSLMPVTALRVMLDHLRSGEPIPDDVKEHWVSGLSKYLDSDGVLLLDRALGLRQRGGISAKRAMQLAERDALIIRTWQAVEDFRDQPPISAAKLMSMNARRYEAGRWPRERAAVMPPVAEPAATWWRILDAGLSIPGAKRLQQILETVGSG